MPYTIAPSLNGTLQQQYKADPRLLMAMQAMQQGDSSAPVQSPLEGIARALQGPLGAYMAKKLQGEYQDKQTDQYGKIADILAPPTDTVSNGPQQTAPLSNGNTLDYSTPQISSTPNPNRDSIIAAMTSGVVKPDSFGTAIADKLGFGKAAEFDPTPRYDQNGNAYLVGKDGSTKPLTGVKARDKAEFAPNGVAVNPFAVTPGTDFSDKSKPFDSATGAPNAPVQKFEMDKQAAGQGPAWANVGIANKRLALDQQKAAADSYGAPAMVGYTGPNGEEVQTAAIYNKKDGTYIDAATHQPITNPKNLRVIGNATGGGRSMAMAGRVATAALDAASDIENLSGIGTGAGMGLFANAATSPLSALSRTLTPQEVQDTQTTMAGLSRAMSLLGSGGMQGSDEVMKSFDRLQPNTGDSMLTTMRKLGSFRQQATNGIDAAISSPMYTPQQKEQLKQAKTRLEAAVPWTPHDVQALENNGESGKSMHDIYSAKLGKGSGNTQTDALLKKYGVTP